MPLVAFFGLVKVIILVVVPTAIVSSLTYLSLVYLPQDISYVSMIIPPLSLVVLWYIIDTYGDRLTPHEKRT